MYCFVNKTHLNSPFSIPGAMLSTTNSTNSTSSTNNTSSTSNISSTSTAIHHHRCPWCLQAQWMCNRWLPLAQLLHQECMSQLQHTRSPSYAILITLRNTHLSPHIDSTYNLTSVCTRVWLWKCVRVSFGPTWQKKVEERDKFNYYCYIKPRYCSIAVIFPPHNFKYLIMYRM